jgi:hypothetical protein
MAIIPKWINIEVPADNWWITNINGIGNVGEVVFWVPAKFDLRY